MPLRIQCLATLITDLQTKSEMCNCFGLYKTPSLPNICSYIPDLLPCSHVIQPPYSHSKVAKTIKCSKISKSKHRWRNQDLYTGAVYCPILITAHQFGIFWRSPKYKKMEKVQNCWVLNTKKRKRFRKGHYYLYIMILQHHYHMKSFWLREIIAHYT